MEMSDYEQLEKTYPRAFKLMKEHKDFIVIASHESYYLDVYSIIRDSEKFQGTWTDEDEMIFENAIMDAAG